MNGDRVQTICVEEGTAVAFRVVYQTQPEEIIVKEFQNERVTEDAAGKIIAKNLQSLTCNPGYTYTIELLYDAESITYGLRCE